MWLGRHQLGTWLDVYLQASDSNGVPAMPNACPQIKIRRSSDEAIVLNSLMPILDRTVQVGLFCSRIFLGTAFTTGQHTVELIYKSGAKQDVLTRTFEVIAAGDARGCVLAMEYYHRPQSDFIVYQAESGLILKGKNPRIS